MSIFIYDFIIKAFPLSSSISSMSNVLFTLSELKYLILMLLFVTVTSELVNINEIVKDEDSDLFKDSLYNVLIPLKFLIYLLIYSPK